MTANGHRCASFKVAITAIIFLVVPSALYAYETEYTHRHLAENAVDLAWTDPSYEELLNYKDTITEGDLREDDAPRFNHHFYDPTTGLGLPQNHYTDLFAKITDLGKIITSVRNFEFPGLDQDPTMTRPSPVSSYENALNWGLRNPDHLDWQGAIEAYDYTPDSRESAYKALGHVLHLIQDMAQPDHAADRPHPGNDPGLRDKLSATPLTIDLLNYVGYEALWALNVWPRGSTVRKLDKIEDFFNKVAAESHAKEEELGLPLQDEMALGLGPLPNFLDPQAMLGGQIEKWLGDATPFHQNGWEHFEAAVPVVPKIPWPHNQDFRTRAYLVLGQRLLPLAEEYSAGLLQFFHDIVAPPPFVMAVEIRQNGELKYRKEFEDLSAVKEKIPGRQLKNDIDTGLDAYKVAEVKIAFGPRAQRDRRTRMREVHVTIEPSEAGTEGKCIDAAAGGRDVEGSVTEATWIGVFFPEKDGVLCITGSDLNNHFQGRSQPGSILDSDPTTPARAIAKPPYEWSGYSPGPDRNHSFKVKLPSCATGQPDPAIVEKMRWGVWSGNVTLRTEGKDFDVAFGDHGKFWSTSDSTTTVDVKFHSNVDPTGLALTVGPSIIAFGNATGSYRVEGNNHFRYFDGYEEDRPVRGSRDAILKGNVYFSKPDHNGQFPYSVNVSARDDSSSQNQWWIENLTGSQCGDGSMKGHIEKEDGDKSGYFYSRRMVTWQFSFKGSVKPEEITRAERLPDGNAIYSSVYNFWLAVDKEINAAKTAIFRYPPSRYQAKYMTCLSQKSCLNEADSSQWSHDQQAIMKGWARVSQLYSTASGDWVKDDDDFHRTLANLSSAIQDWQTTKLTAERKFADAVEHAATEVREVAPDRAQALLQLAQKMRDVGLTAF